MAKGPQIEKEIRDEIEHVEKLTLVYFLFFFYSVCGFIDECITKCPAVPNVLRFISILFRQNFENVIVCYSTRCFLYSSGTCPSS